MDTIINNVLVHFEYFVLIFLRITALIVSSPVFGRKTIPNQTKIAFCLVLSYVVLAATVTIPVISYKNVLEYGVLCVKELLFGLVLGYVTTLFFAVVQVAGHVIDMQMGFGMVNVFDVQSNISVPVSGNFLYTILMLVFFAVDGHHQLIYIINSTFANVPPGQVTINPAIGWSALEVFVLAFGLALKVAMPVVASGLIGEVIMGVVVRTAPQMNVFVVGIPLKIILGLMALSIILPVYVSFSNELFGRMFESVNYMLQGLARAA